MYAKLTCLRQADGTAKSPVVFVHGFPDSPAMFAAYYTEAEREQPWLAGRSLYCYAFPNRHDNPNFPPLAELSGGVMAREFDQTMERGRFAGSANVYWRERRTGGIMRQRQKPWKDNNVLS